LRNLEYSPNGEGCGGQVELDFLRSSSRRAASCGSCRGGGASAGPPGASSRRLRAASALDLTHVRRRSRTMTRLARPDRARSDSRLGRHSRPGEFGRLRPQEWGLGKAAQAGGDLGLPTPVGRSSGGSWRHLFGEGRPGALAAPAVAQGQRPQRAWRHCGRQIAVEFGTISRGEIPSSRAFQPSPGPGSVLCRPDVAARPWPAGRCPQRSVEFHQRPRRRQGERGRPKPNGGHGHCRVSKHVADTESEDGGLCAQIRIASSRRR